MRGGWRTTLTVFLAIGGAIVASGAISRGGAAAGNRAALGSRALEMVTLNTHAYGVKPGGIDRRSVKFTAEEDMHIVALEHFIGVGKGSLSDNGHILSAGPDNPWSKWEKAGTGMEPTGIRGYFGYCGRDYYSEVDGVDDVMAYESFPAGTYVLIQKGQTLYMHCYANNFSPERPGFFHHMVRVLYW